MSDDSLANRLVGGEREHGDVQPSVHGHLGADISRGVQSETVQLMTTGVQCDVSEDAAARPVWVQTFGCRSGCEV